VRIGSHTIASMLSTSVSSSRGAAAQQRATRATAGCARAPLRRTPCRAAPTSAAATTTSSSSAPTTTFSGLAGRAAAALTAALLLGTVPAPSAAWAAAAALPSPQMELAELAAAAPMDEEQVMNRYNSDMEELAQVRASGVVDTCRGGGGGVLLSWMDCQLNPTICNQPQMVDPEAVVPPELNEFLALFQKVGRCGRCAADWIVLESKE